MPPSSPTRTLAHEDRLKWNARYRESSLIAPPQRPACHPLALRWKSRFVGGPMLDAACGLGRGVACGIDRFAPIYAVDVSDVAIVTARNLWPQSNIRWIIGDVTALPWEEEAFGLICSFRFTDRAFMKRMLTYVRPGGMILFEGFSERQLETKPDRNPAWTMTRSGLAELFASWEVLEIGESSAPHFLVHCAAIRPKRT